MLSAIGTSRQRTPRIHPIFWLGLILILAAGLRIYGLTSTSVWVDEFFSLECSAGWSRADLHLTPSHTPAPDLVSLPAARPWWSIWTSMGRDENHPPLYFIVLRGWRAMFGDGVAALRSLSVVAALLAIVLLYCVGVTIDRPEAALWACALMAVAWPQIHESQEARPYMVVTMVSLACALALLRIERFGVTRARMICLFLTALALPLLNYMAITPVIALVLYTTFALRGKVRRQLLLCIAAAMLVYAATWGPQLIRQPSQMMGGTVWIVDKSPAAKWHTFQRLMTAPARLFMEPEMHGLLIATASGVALVVPLLLLRRRRQLLLLWLWLVIPIGTLLVVDLSVGRASLQLTRYFLTAAPALFLMLGMIAVTGRWGRVVPAIVVLSCMLCLPNVYTTDLPDWRPLARFVVQTTRPGDAILLVDRRPAYSGAFWLLGLTYYAGGDRPIYLIKGPPSPARLSAFATEHLCVVGTIADFDAMRLPTGARMEHADLFVGLGVAAEVSLPKTAMPKETVVRVPKRAGEPSS